MSAPLEHPEDKARRLEAQKEAAAFGTRIVERYGAALAALVLTYGDDDAHEQLDALRGRFWAIDLPKAVKHGGKP